MQVIVIIVIDYVFSVASKSHWIVMQTVRKSIDPPKMSFLFGYWLLIKNNQVEIAVEFGVTWKMMFI